MTESSTAPNDLMPVAIERDGDSSIRIKWNDETETVWTVAELRTACPCATCREKRRGDEQKKTDKPGLLPVLSAEEARPLTIESMKPVGSYAYTIGFSDGHSSGIYPFATLYEKTSP